VVNRIAVLTLINHKSRKPFESFKTFFFDSEKLTTFAVWRLINSAGFLFVYISAFLEFQKFCFFLPFMLHTFCSISVSVCIPEKT
jgi:hypothetical protein